MPVLAAIVPPSFFAPQQTWTLWVVFLVSLAALAWAADRTVSSAVQLARRFGVSKVIVGATIVSLGTTTPEACVSVASALNGNAGIALGNAVGSIIFNTCLIFGSCCLVRSLPMDRFVMNRHGWLLVGAGMVLTLTCFGLWAAGGDIRAVVLPRQVGIVYLVLLTGYLFVSARWARQHPLEAIEGFEEASHGRELPAAAWTAILGLACGLAVIALSSDTLVGSVEVICRRMGVPEAVIAVTLVAFGTSLPELSTAVTALIKGHEDLTVGNIIGANILNVLFVIGAAATASPLRVDPYFFRLYLPTMMAVLVLFQLPVLAGRTRFQRWQGLPLVAIYALFLFLTGRTAFVR